jgi:hypothetical protein
MFPLAGAVYRSVLGPCDFSLHACGDSGLFKTETVALFQQHFGRGLDSRHLPGSWSSTGNALVLLGFTCKDAIIVVDDFAPSGTGFDIQRSHRDADKVLRAQGNSAGRKRLRPDASLTAGLPPRGLFVSTGEDVPRGRSLQARLLVLEFSAGDIDRVRLSACQHDAMTGAYAATLAGFLCWLSRRFREIQEQLTAEVAELRERALAGSEHARTPGIVANLAVGWRHFLAFAVESGAISVEESNDLFRRAWVALGEAAKGQTKDLEAADVVNQFLELLAGVLASGRGHCANSDGAVPPDPGAWGWRRQGMEPLWQPQGRRVGWVAGADLYLEPATVYAEVQDLARAQGESLSVTKRTLHKRLKDRGLLASHEEGKLVTRRTLEGPRRFVLHLFASVLCPQKQGESGRQDEDPEESRDSYRLPSPSINGQASMQGEQTGQNAAQKPGSSGSSPIPPIPPVSSRTSAREVFEL